MQDAPLQPPKWVVMLARCNEVEDQESVQTKAWFWLLEIARARAHRTGTLPPVLELVQTRVPRCGAGVQCPEAHCGVQLRARKFFMRRPILYPLSRPRTCGRNRCQDYEEAEEEDQPEGMDDESRDRSKTNKLHNMIKKAYRKPWCMPGTSAAPGRSKESWSTTCSWWTRKASTSWMKVLSFLAAMPGIAPAQQVCHPQCTMTDISRWSTKYGANTGDIHSCRHFHIDVFCAVFHDSQNHLPRHLCTHFDDGPWGSGSVNAMPTPKN